MNRLILAVLLAALLAFVLGSSILAQTQSAKLVPISCGSSGQLYTNGSQYFMRIGVVLAPGEGIILLNGGTNWQHDPFVGPIPKWPGQ